MIVGIPKEIKPFEYRVGIVPDGVEQLTKRGHQVLIQTGAGEGSDIRDEDFADAGAEIAPDAAQIYSRAALIIKVKEPQPEEYRHLRDGQTIFTFFHFAASHDLTESVRASGAVAIAYETMHTPDGHHPLLTPMSEIAGKMAVQEGAKYLERPTGGRGVLIGGVPGVAPAEVLVIGGGIVGANAAKVAAGLGAHVTVFDINLERLRYLDDIMPRNVSTLFCNAHNLREKVQTADLVIGAVMVEGARAPILVTEEMVTTMPRGSVVVDVAVDQGGCIETSRPTTHGEPTFTVHDVVHYGVANIPGAVGRTSTIALTNVTIGYALEIAGKGWERATTENSVIRSGLNICRGEVVNTAVAETFGYSEPEEELTSAGVAP